jgi:hypothetical protein
MMMPRPADPECFEGSELHLFQRKFDCSIWVEMALSKAHNMMPAMIQGCSCIMVLWLEVQMYAFLSV